MKSQGYLRPLAPTIEIDQELFAPFELEWVKSPSKTDWFKMQVFN